MLHQIDDKGKFYKLHDLPYRGNYDRWLAKFGKAGFSLDAVKSHITERIAGLQKFSVATDFGGSWENTPLQSVYAVCRNDSEQAAFLLGRMVMDILITAEDSWLCTKTNLQDRDFAANFYWRSKA